MFDGLDSLLGRETESDAVEAGECRCDPATDAPEELLRIDASDCPGHGRLDTEPSCRATTVDTLDGRDVRAIRTTTAGVARTYEGRGVAMLVAAGRFAELASVHDSALAARGRHDPLGAAAEAAGRSDPVARVAAESGLLAVAEDVSDYRVTLSPLVGPTVSRSLIGRAPPSEAALAERYELDTGAVVRVYEPSGEGTGTPRRYHIEPPVVRLPTATLEPLAMARERLAANGDGPAAAVEAALDGTDPSLRGTTPDDIDTTTATLARILGKHTRGAGILEDLFADTAVSDVFATSPVAETPLRIRRGDETMSTNVRLTAAGAASLAGRFRRDSGRAFSRASPTLAATTTLADRRVRVAGVTGPVSDGHAFAFRAHDRETWQLADLVANGTVTPPVAGLLSLAVERGVACLVTGERGAGKTTLLAALLWELPPATRTVVVEDTPELPATALQEAGRDVQALRVADDADTHEVTAAEALRAALRLGESALVVGEVRGEEARTLYEAMRVGAGGSAVLGTVHGDGAATVRERMVTDLGVPASSFADTDLLVTVGARETARGRERRVRRVEEVVRTEGGDAAFAPLHESRNGSISATDRLTDGETEVVAGLQEPEESHDDVLAAAAERGEKLAAEAEQVGGTGEDR